MGCGGSAKSPDKPIKMMDEVAEGEKSGELIEDELGEDQLAEEAPGEPEEVKEEIPSQAELVERDPKHIFTVKFKKKPLGIILTSARDGACAYVTDVDGKNKAVRKNNLPIGSKLLKVNEADVEMEQINDVTDLILDGLKNLPMSLTFCHPDGLNDDEIPDPDPNDD